MRFYRDDQVDLWEAPPTEFRSDGLRELVDALPKRQRHLVSRVYFGGAPLTEAAAEIYLTMPQARRSLQIAMERLKRALSEED